MTTLRNVLFWPLLLITIGLTAFILYQRLSPFQPQGSTNTGRQSLFLKDVVMQTGSIELAEVTFDHWEKRTVSTAILTPGPLGAVVNEYIPSIVLNKLREQGWNQSTADIITTCTASVEFEIPMNDPDWGSIDISGNVATVNAPEPRTGAINIRPETLEGWVLREDLLISGKKEKDRLLHDVRANIEDRVSTPEFRQKYRESCRMSLQNFFRNLFSHTDALSQVEHVYIRFKDDPAVKEN